MASKDVRKVFWRIWHISKIKQNYFNYMTTTKPSCIKIPNRQYDGADFFYDPVSVASRGSRWTLQYDWRKKEVLTVLNVPAFGKI